jgi:hypothetical protein
MKTTFQTLQDILDFNNKNSNLSVSDIIDAVLKSNESFRPERPMKPYLAKNHTSDEAIKYANNLAEYEKEYQAYQEKLIFHNSTQNRLNELVVEFIKEASCLTSDVPVKYRDRVYSFAYEKSHSGGYCEVYNTLCDLVDIFDEE